MTTGERLKEVRTATGGTQAGFATSIGVKQSYLGGIERGEKNLSQDLITSLVEVHKVNANWLLTGEGAMFIGKSDGCIDDPAMIRESLAEFQIAQAEVVQPEDVSIPSRFGTKNGASVSISNGAVVNVPILTQRASAGPGQEMLDIQNAEGHLPILVDFLAPHRPGNCLAIKVVGDSMAEIHLNNGDYVVFDNTDNDASGGGLFVITFRGVILVKRLEFNVEEQIVYIRSENRRYGTPQKATKTDMEDGNLRIEGKVVAWIHRHWY